MYWYGKPYYSLDAYCKNTFGEKIYKIALDAGMTCPNRDGSIDTRGCIFCSAGGSGDFAEHNSQLSVFKEEIETTGHASPRVSDAIHNSISQQIEEGLATQLASKHTGCRFIAYFQSYTNTYAPISYLREIFSAALSSPCIIGISIGTRPDCITEAICLLFEDLKEQYPDKFIWVELGLQTIHEETACYIRRGYSLPCFEASLHLLQSHDISVIIHVILGLPHETTDMMLQTIHYLNTCHIQGIKLQLLHILKNTDLCIDYESRKFEVLSLDDYINLVIACLSILSPEIVIHRVTGDGPKNILAAPLWSRNKRNVLNTLHQEMNKRKIQQGDKFEN